MSNIAKLKKQAAEFEQKKQFDRALAKYIQILDLLDGAVDEADVALYNRVGDLLLKQGNISQAVDYYERAVDHYTEGGFFNNAIALCNKILRNAPGRNSVYYKLGKISAQKGFVNDAKQNFLEYADRMQNAGQLEEAFRALKEFADLCPDQDDIRLMLADQLVRKNRKSEAIEQLQTLYEKFQAEGRTREARATVDRIKAIDPEVEPRATTASPTPKAGDLIFLNVDYDAPPSAARSMRTSVPIYPPLDDDEGAPPRRRPASDLPLILPDLDDEPAPEPAAPAAATEPAEPMSGLEHTALGDDASQTFDVTPVAGLQPSGASLGDVEVEQARQAPDELADGVLDMPMLDDALTTFDDFPSAAAQDTMDGPASGAIADEHSGLGDLPSLDVDEGSLGVADLPLEYDEEPEPAAPRVSEELTAADLVVPDVEPVLILPETGLVVPDSIEPSSEEDSPDEPAFDIAREQSAFLDSQEPQEIVVQHDSEPDLAALSNAFERELSPIEQETPVPAASASRSPLAGGDIDGFADDIGAALDAALEGEEEIVPFLARGVQAPTPAEPVIAAVAREPEPEESASERMRRQLEIEPDNWPLRRSFAEALLEEGERNQGLRELDQVMIGFERWSDFVAARSVAEEILHVDPNSVKHHQKRVEYAFRASDKSGLVDAYLELADCLFRAGQLEKSRAVYQRVLELAPQDPRAQEALRAYGKSEHMPPVDMPRVTPVIADMPRVRPAAPRQEPVGGMVEGDAGFVNLGDLLREDEQRKTTRMVVDVQEPGMEDQVGFAEMLQMFKQGVAANVEEGDHQSHYDLGVAYKEMGLLDEAISEFQKALRGTEQRVRTYEALGQCFVEKRQYQIAITILSRALNDKRYSDDMLVGVLYLLGTASESLERWPDAVAYYQRVFAVDIEFRDVAARLAGAERRAR